MQMKLESFDVQRIERIKKLTTELYGEEVASDWAVVSAALRVYEVGLKVELRKKRGEKDEY